MLFKKNYIVNFYFFINNFYKNIYKIKLMYIFILLVLLIINIFNILSTPLLDFIINHTSSNDGGGTSSDGFSSSDGNSGFNQNNIPPSSGGEEMSIITSFHSSDYESHYSSGSSSQEEFDIWRDRYERESLARERAFKLELERTSSPSTLSVYIQSKNTLHNNVNLYNNLLSSHAELEKANSFLNNNNSTYLQNSQQMCEIKQKLSNLESVIIANQNEVHKCLDDIQNRGF
jgi:hypothetical protein